MVCCSFFQPSDAGHLGSRSAKDDVTPAVGFCIASSTASCSRRVLGSHRVVPFAVEPLPSGLIAPSPPGSVPPSRSELIVICGGPPSSRTPSPFAAFPSETNVAMLKATVQLLIRLCSVSLHPPKHITV